MQIVLLIHSLLRWAILFCGVLAFIKSLNGIATKRAYGKGDNVSSLLFSIFFDTQLIFGLILFFVGPWFSMMKYSGAQVMQDPHSRFFAVEHGTMMLLSLVLVHIGRAKVKKAATDDKKFMTTAIFFGIALVLLYAAIPWPWKELIGRPLL